MGKVTGFKEFNREVEPFRNPKKGYWISKKYIPIMMSPCLTLKHQDV